MAIQNPAYLSLMKTDRLFLTSGVPAGLFVNPSGPESGHRVITLSNGLRVAEDASPIKLGYSFPLSNNLAFGVEGFATHEELSVKTGTSALGGVVGSSDFTGGGTSLSYRLSENVSLGASFFSYMASNGKSSGNSVSDQGSAASFEGGFLIKNTDSSVIFDSRLAYSNEKVPQVSTTGTGQLTIASTYRLPVVLENTFTLAMDRNKSFFVLKEINYFYADGAVTADLIPALENWLSDSFSLRGGVEGKFMKLAGSSAFGFGGIAGFTFRTGSFDLDVSGEYRERPSFIVPTEKFNEILFSITLSIKDLFFGK
jgi:hypothetical protein